MDDYDEYKQWEKALKQGNKIRKRIAKELKGNSVLKILDDITPELYEDDDSDTAHWRYRSGSDDLERHNYLKKELKNMPTKEKNKLLKEYTKNPNTLLKRPLGNLAAVEDVNLYDKNPDKWRLKMDQLDRLRKAQLNIAKGLGSRASAINDNIMRATNKMGGAMFAKPAGLGEQAAGYLKTVAPGFGSKALGIMSNPFAAAMAGMFAPTQMGNSEFLGSPQHQQWLARRGPLSKDWQ